MQNKKPFLILIGGGSGASKSALSKKIEEHFGKDKCTMLLRRDYYHDNSQNPNFVVFNDPKNQDIDRLLIDLNKLLAGQDTYSPQIKREKWVGGVKLTRTENAQLKKSTPIIIYDGVTALQDKRVRKLADLKIFLHTDDDIRFIKKMQKSRWYKKTIGEKDGRSEEELERNSSLTESLPEQIENWLKYARPVFRKFVEPTKQYADYVFINNKKGDLEKIASDVINLVEKNKNHVFRSQIDSKKSQDLIIKQLEKDLKTAQQERERENKITLNCWGRNRNFSFRNFFDAYLEKKKYLV